MGAALVPYYKRLLPQFNLTLAKNTTVKAALRAANDLADVTLGDSVVETLECLEATGGPDATEALTKMIPNYRSVYVTP